jgi:hypothetical protein
MKLTFSGSGPGGQKEVVGIFCFFTKSQEPFGILLRKKEKTFYKEECRKQNAPHFPNGKRYKKNKKKIQENRMQDTHPPYPPSCFLLPGEGLALPTPQGVSDSLFRYS